MMLVLATKHLSRICVLSGVLITPVAFGQSAEETTERIDKYAQVLEGDAAHYEAKYRSEAESLLRWRLGWEFLISISDQAFALRVAKERIDASVARSQILRDYAVRRVTDAPAPEIVYIHSMALADLASAEAILGLLQRNSLRACDEETVLRSIASVPTDSVLMRQSPNVAIYPIVRSDPILRINFAIGLDGSIAIAPAPYQNEAQGQGKMAVPAIASTVSYALVLQFMGPTAWAPATAIATFVYLLADHAQRQYEEGKLADAVKRMNTAIVRIEAAQNAAFLGIDGARLSIGGEVCKDSFSPSLRRLEFLGTQATASLKRARVELESAAQQLRPRSDADDWTRVECEIFRCPENTSYFTWKLGELVGEIQKRNGSD